MFVLKFFTRKPAAVAWRVPQPVPDTNVTLNQWTRLQPGVLSVRSRKPTKNRVVTIIKCANEAAADAYLAALATNVEHHARQEYRAANGITYTLVKWERVS